MSKVQPREVPESERHAIHLARVERLLGDKIPFDRYSECPKCGIPADHHKWNFCYGYENERTALVRQSLAPGQQPCPIMGEHLHKKCPCGFEYVTYPKDDPDGEKARMMRGE